VSQNTIRRLLLTARIIGWVVGSVLFYLLIAVCLAAIVVNAGMTNEPLMLAIVFGGPIVLAAITLGLGEWYDRRWYKQFAKQQLQMFNVSVAEMERDR
jgi:hypothetical protein